MVYYLYIESLWLVKRQESRFGRFKKAVDARGGENGSISSITDLYKGELSPLLMLPFRPPILYSSSRFLSV